MVSGFGAWGGQYGPFGKGREGPFLGLPYYWFREVNLRKPLCILICLYTPCRTLVDPFGGVDISGGAFKTFRSYLKGLKMSSTTKWQPSRTELQGCGIRLKVWAGYCPTQ